MKPLFFFKGLAAARHRDCPENLGADNVLQTEMKPQPGVRISAHAELEVAPLSIGEVKLEQVDHARIRGSVPSAANAGKSPGS